MKYYRKFLTAVAGALILPVLAAGQARQYDGTVKAGFLYLDRDGNNGVDQSTFNLYQGLELSLERFSYRLDNGINLSANIHNAALGNRNLSLGATRIGKWGVGLNHNSYRRRYDFDGDVYTKRHRSSGHLWWQAHRDIKLDAGVGVTSKNGDALDFFDPETTASINAVDYSHWFYNAGLTFKRSRRTVQVEYRTSFFSDNVDRQNDRIIRRFRISGSAPVPGREDLIINGGYQYYLGAFDYRSDTLKAHTLWAGARFTFGQGYSVRYSFIADRARRHGDLTESDNIAHALYAGKNWLRRGGVTVGFRYRVNDDALDELSGSGYFATVWWRPVTDLTLRAGYGADDMEVDDGHTLTGRTERSRGWASAYYRKDYGWVRLSLQNRQTDNNEIGSSTDYLRLAADLSVNLTEYGSLAGSYSYGNGEFKNNSGSFEYDEHLINGDITSREYKNFTLGFGGSYLRSHRDLDIESFSVRFSGGYGFNDKWGLQASYSSRNFDDFNNPLPVYTEYYTDNVVQISLTYDL